MARTDSSPKKILMIQPWIYDLAAFDLWIKPIGLMYIATILEKIGFEVAYLDCLNPDHPSMQGKLKRMEDGRGKFYREEIDKPDAYKTITRRYCRYGLPESIVREEIRKVGKADAIFITSMMTYWYPALKRIVELCRELLPGIPIVLGGVYASLMPEHARSIVKPDMVVVGAGENQVKDLVQQLFPEMAIEHLHANDLYPAWHKLEKVAYLPVLTSRGCPYRCSYCATNKLYSGFMQRSWQQILEEIIFFYDAYAFKDIVFYDDALLVNYHEHVLQVLRKLKEKNMIFRFHTPNGLNARFISDEVAEAMFDAKFETVRISLETADDERQKLHGDKVTRKEFEAAMKSLFHAGYKPGQIGVYLLAGMPGQSMEEVKESIRFVHDNGGLVKISLYSPIPGTEDFLKYPESIQKQLREEPLLQNCSIFPLLFNYISWTEYEEMKAWIDELNNSHV